MSEEIERFHLKYCELSGTSTMEASKKGEYVFYDDYLKLVEENQQLLLELVSKDANGN